MASDLVRVEAQGLYCAAGDFFIDPWRPVDRALITHAHSDHARTGSREYFCAERGLDLLRHRLRATENQIPITGLPYGKKNKFGETWVSFHSAGHVLGSAQIRIEHKDRVWVVSGDYKRDADLSCDPFEVVPCNVFISEATFALPIYRWEAPEVIAKRIFDWWQGDLTRPSLLFCYALGKAQRVLAELRRFTERPVYVHGAVESLTSIYRQAGIEMLPTQNLSSVDRSYDFRGDLILAPPSAHRSPWMKRFKDPQTAFASGWMQVRGARRRRGYEKGFVLSDHADWTGLIRSVKDSEATCVFLTHGKTDVLARYLREQENREVRLFTTEYDDPEEAS